MTNNNQPTVRNDREIARMGALLERKLEGERGEEVQPVDAVVVIRDGEWREAVQKREQLWRRGGVLWPGDTGLAVRIEVVDEVDKEVGHVSATIYVQNVRSMSLCASADKR